MTGADPQDGQAEVDVHRAGVLLSLDQGIDIEASTQALKIRAAVDGVSLHAAALAVLWPDPVDRPSEGEAVPSARHQGRRHLFAVPTSRAEEQATSTGEIGSAG